MLTTAMPPRTAVHAVLLAFAMLTAPALGGTVMGAVPARAASHAATEAAPQTAFADPVRRDLYERSLVGDAEKRADLLGDLWHPDGSVQLGAFPRVQGRQNVEAFFAQFLGNPLLASLTHEMEQVWELPDASIYTATAIYDLADGTQLRVPYTNIVRYRDDLFHDYRVFVDTAPLMAKFAELAGEKGE